MSSFCPLCLKEVAHTLEPCPTCSDELDKARCLLPLRQTQFGDWVMFAFHYVDLTRNLMLNFKYRKAFYLSRFFAQELWKNIHSNFPWQKSVIVPVPSSIQKNPETQISTSGTACSKFAFLFWLAPLLQASL